jgi:hypothetical protein
MGVRAGFLDEVSGGSWREITRVFRDEGCKIVDDCAAATKSLHTTTYPEAKPRISRARRATGLLAGRNGGCPQFAGAWAFLF